MSESPAHILPDLSVVLCVDGQRQRGARALACLLAQSIVDRMEIVLQDVGHADHPPLPQSDHPSVRLINVPRGLGFGEALARGALAARAPIVAFQEEHVVVLAGWAEAIVRAHQGPWAVVGSEVALDNPGRGHSDTIDLFAVGPWIPPAESGEVRFVRWQNAAYKRDVLLRYADRLSQYLDAEGVFFTQLQADGYRLWQEQTAKMRHANEDGFGEFIRGVVTANRLSASARAELLQFTLGQRLLRVGSSAVNAIRLPGYLLRYFSRSPHYTSRRALAWRKMPFVIVYAGALGLGAMMGFLLGRGRVAQTFLYYELNAGRDIRGYEQPPLV